MSAERLDLTAFSNRDRFDVWRALAAPFFDVRLPPEVARSFGGEVASVPLGEALLIHSRVSGQYYERDAARVRRGHWDQVAIQFYGTGSFVGDYDGHAVRVGPGEVNIIDFTRPYRKLSTDEADFNLIVPREAASRLYPGFVHGSVRDRMAPQVALIGVQLSALATIGADLSVEEAEAAVEAVLALLARSDARAASPAARASLRASLRQRAAAYIRVHLLEPDLDPDRVCRACRVSRASLFRACEQDGGVGNLIRTERLHLAARLLRDGPEIPVGDIAASCGFTDRSQFARQFRRAFGRSPSDERSRPVEDRATSDPRAWLEIFRRLLAAVSP